MLIQWQFFLFRYLYQRGLSGHRIRVDRNARYPGRFVRSIFRIDMQFLNRRQCIFAVDHPANPKLPKSPKLINQSIDQSINQSINQ